MDRRLALRPSALSARYWARCQSAHRRSRYGRVPRREHPGGYRSHSVGSRISGDSALQRRLPLVPAADHHGRAETDAAVHRQSGAPMVLRHQGLQRDGHRVRTGRYRECHLQRMRGPDQGTSDYQRKDHGWLEIVVVECAHSL